MRTGLWIGLVAMLLAGCASRNVTIRSLPPETPAADNAAAIEYAATLAAAFASEPKTPPEQSSANAPAVTPPEVGAVPAPEAPPVTPAQAPPMTPAEAPPMQTYDPWERLNRFTYRFNTRFDEAIFLPVSNGYRRLPSPIRTGVHNFFGNLAEVDSVINYTLQWRLGSSLRSLGRFVINSTVGIGGLIDFAGKLKLASAPTGFSTTLAKWGVHLGPYLVIPLLGPSTFRDGVGFLADYGAMYGVDVAHLYRGDVSWGLGVADAVDQRSNIGFRYYSTGSPFEYDAIRFLYVHKRLIEDQGMHAKGPPKQHGDGSADK
jgi:phospholipid-binding lipoprotein MlaA